MNKLTAVDQFKFYYNEFREICINKHRNINAQIK